MFVKKEVIQAYAGPGYWDKRSAVQGTENERAVRKWVHEFIPFILENKIKKVLDLGKEVHI